MHHESPTARPTTTPSALMYANDNNGPTALNDVAALPESLSHTSFLQPSSGGGYSPAYHTSYTTRSSRQHSRAVDNASDAAELLSPLLSSNVWPLSAEAGASFNASAAPTTTAASDDSFSPDGKSQLLQYPHSPTNASATTASAAAATTPTMTAAAAAAVTTALDYHNETTAQNTSITAFAAAMPSATATASSPAITDSSSDRTGVPRVRPYALSHLQHCPPTDGSFLAAAAPASDGAASPAPAAQEAETLAAVLGRSRPASSPPPSTGGMELRAASHHLHPSTSPISSSLSSVPHSTAETQCHDTVDRHHESAGLPLPTAVDAATAAASVTSLTVSSASATASPLATARLPVADSVTPGKTPSAAAANPPQQQQQHEVTEAAVQAGVADDDAAPSPGSPPISLGESATHTLASSSSSLSEQRSASRSSSTQALREVRSGRHDPIPRPPPVSAPSGSRGGDTTASTQSGQTVSGSSGGGTAGSRYSVVTLDSTFAPRPRGSNLVGLRAVSPDAALLQLGGPQQQQQPMLRSDPSGSPLTQTPLWPTSFPQSSSNTLTHTSATSFSPVRGPGFMSRSSTPSLAAFPKLDAPLRTAQAASAVAISASTPTVAAQAGRCSPTGDEADTRLAVERRARASLPSPLSAVRVVAPLEVADCVATGTTQQDDPTRDSHRQLSSETRPLDRDSSVHSSSLPQQNSRGFTVTSASFAFDTQWYDAHSPRARPYARHSVHDSAVSLYHSPSMLSDSVLQTLAHGMALGGAAHAPWQSVDAAIAATHNASFAGAFAGSPMASAMRPRGVALPLPTALYAGLDAESSLCASRSNNYACVRLPSHAAARASVSRRASQSTAAGGAAAAALLLSDCSVTNGASYLLGTSSLVPDAHSSALSPFLASTRSPAPPRATAHAASGAATPAARTVFTHELTSGRGATSSLSRPAVPHFALARASSPNGLRATPPRQTGRDPLIPVLGANTHSPRPSGSGYLFAAVDGDGSGSGSGESQPRRCSTADYAAYRGNVSQAGASASWQSLRARSTAAAVAAASQSFSHLASPSSPLQAGAPPTRGHKRGSSAPALSERSLAPSESARMIAFPSDSPDLSVADGLREVSRGGGEGQSLWRPRSTAEGGAHSGVARRRVPSGGFSTGDSSSGQAMAMMAMMMPTAAAATTTTTMATPAAPGATRDLQGTFLQSVHAASGGPVTMAPFGYNPALRHFFASGSPSLSACMASGVFAHSLAGSTGGYGVFRGEAPSTDPSLMLPSADCFSDASPHASRSFSDSADHTLSLPEVRATAHGVEREKKAEGDADDVHDGDGGCSTAAAAAAADAVECDRDGADLSLPVVDDPSEVSCSIASSPPPSACLPQPLREPTTTHAPSTSLLSTPAVMSGGGMGFGDAMMHVLPLAEREHASLSGSSRLPTLHSLNSSAKLCRADPARGERFRGGRPALQRRSPWVARQARPSFAMSPASPTAVDGGLDSSLQRSRPFANSFDREASTVEQSELSLFAATGGGDGDTAPSPRRSTANAALPRHAHYGGPQAGSQPPRSRFAPPPVSSTDTSSLGRDSNSRGLNRGLLSATNDEGDGSRHLIAAPGAAIMGATAAAVVAAPPPSSALPHRQRTSAAGGERGHLSIPSFHAHRDVEAMLDDAETVLRRAPVSIIPVLHSRLTRAMNPSLTGSLGCSVSATGTSVMSVRTPGMTLSTTVSDTRRTSDAASAVAKGQRSRTLTEASLSSAQR